MQGPSSTKGVQQPVLNGSGDAGAARKLASSAMAVPTAMDDDALFDGAPAAVPAPKAPVSRLGIVQREARKVRCRFTPGITKNLATHAPPERQKSVLWKIVATSRSSSEERGMCSMLWNTLGDTSIFS